MCIHNKLLSSFLTEFSAGWCRPSQYFLSWVQVLKEEQHARDAQQAFLSVAPAVKDTMVVWQAYSTVNALQSKPVKINEIKYT